ncbi:MAG: GAF domain-containing protein [Candidatus Riflebacteria bacterium]|nr:GAF domain-containing protein [Candidatus Riflebacteria bacterium]
MSGDGVLPPLRLLAVNFRDADVAMVTAAIRGWAEVSCECVFSVPATVLSHALAQPGWDAVLVDPVVEGVVLVEVLDAILAAGLDAPTILLTDHLSDAQCVELMRRGANACVFRQRIALLGPVLVRESLGAQERCAHREALRQLRLRSEELQVTTDAMAEFLETGAWQTAGGLLLRAAVSSTNSRHGFVGVVLDGPMVRCSARDGFVLDTSLGDGFRDWISTHTNAAGFLEFTQFDNVVGQAIRTRRPVLIGGKDGERFRGAFPDGHPALETFLGMPILKGTDVVGLLGLANRPGGYTEVEVDRLSLLMRTAGVVFDGCRRRDREDSLEDQLRQAQNGPAA